jgi:hypothetical protein
MVRVTPEFTEMLPLTMYVLDAVVHVWFVVMLLLIVVSAEAGDAKVHKPKTSKHNANNFFLFNIQKCLIYIHETITSPPTH